MKGKKRAAGMLGVLTVLAVWSAAAWGAACTIPNRPSDGSDRNPTLQNARFDAIEACVEDIDSYNINNASIMAVDMYCGVGSDWGLLTDCDAVDNADAMHSHDAAAITITSATYTGSTLEDALDEVAAYVNYTAAASAAATTTVSLKYAGMAVDITSQYPTTQPGATVTVATGTTSLGIVAHISANFENIGTTNTCNLNVPLRVNTTNLSESGSEVKRYVVAMGSAGGVAVAGTFSNTIVYRVADGWATDQVNEIGIGTVYSGSGSVDCSGSTVQNYQIVIESM